MRVIVNNTDLTLDDADQLLPLGLSFIPTPRPSVSTLENEWTELNQHLRRVEWENVLSTEQTSDDSSSNSNSDRIEDEQIPSKLQFTKHNRPSSDQLDEATIAYAELCTAQLRNIKPKLNNQFMNHNNVSLELQRSLKKLTDISKSGRYVFCRSDKDGKIVIVTREDFKTIMNREISKDRMETINSGNIQQALGSIKFDVEEKTKKLHGEGGISDKLLLHTIGFYQTENGDYSRVKKNAKYFTVGNPG